MFYSPNNSFYFSFRSNLISVLLKREFYLDTDPVCLARELLGKILCSHVEGSYCEGVIVETEAYKAPEDKASHAYGNRLTERTSTMFGEGGRCYIYLCYGIHEMFNIVSAPENIAHAILIRAIEPLEGLETMRKRRGRIKEDKNLGNGPGKLCKAMGISRNLNGQILYHKNSLLSIRDPGPSAINILAGPRVGIAYAGECANWPWRFRIKDNPYTSLPDNPEYNI